jgi:hypothetical protein
MASIGHDDFQPLLDVAERLTTLSRRTSPEFIARLWPTFTEAAYLQEQAEPPPREPT